MTQDGANLEPRSQDGAMIDQDEAKIGVHSGILGSSLGSSWASLSGATLELLTITWKLLGALGRLEVLGRIIASTGSFKGTFWTQLGPCGADVGLDSARVGYNFQVTASKCFWNRP